MKIDVPNSLNIVTTPQSFNAVRVLWTPQFVFLTT
jgi:hypothetical protein